MHVWNVNQIATCGFCIDKEITAVKELDIIILP